MSLKSRVDGIEAKLGRQTADAGPMEELAPWGGFWSSSISEFPPEFPPDMPERARHHIVNMVLMLLYTCPRPLEEIPEFLQPYLPDDLVDHLKQQHPTDTDLAAKSDFEWEELRGEFTPPHYQTLTERRQALRTAATP